MRDTLQVILPAMRGPIQFLIPWKPLTLSVLHLSGIFHCWCLIFIQLIKMNCLVTGNYGVFEFQM